MSRRQRRQAFGVSMDDSQFATLIDTLHNLVKAIASAQVRLENGTDRNARFLKTFGLSETEIANLLGVTQPAVNQALRRARKKRKKA